MPVLVLGEQGSDEWVVKAGVSDKDAVKLKNGDMAEVVLDAFPGLKFPAFVSQVAESADPVSGTFEVEITIDPLNQNFINGLVAKAKIESKNNQIVTLVPPDAVMEAQGNNGYVFVFKTTDSTVKKIPVTIAYLDNKNIAVIEAVNKIGPVITKGASYLDEGSKVYVSE
jgi:multidrug efflux system membrane fusion protein